MSRRENQVCFNFVNALGGLSPRSKAKEPRSSTRSCHRVVLAMAVTCPGGDWRATCVQRVRGRSSTNRFSVVASPKPRVVAPARQSLHTSVRCSSEGDTANDGGAASSGSSKQQAGEQASSSTLSSLGGSTLSSLDALLGLPSQQQLQQEAEKEQQRRARDAAAATAAAERAGAAASSGERQQGGDTGWWSSPAPTNQTRAPRK